MFEATSVEKILVALQPAIITILFVILLRFILNRVFTTLTDRGTITLSTKATIMRFIDIIVFFIVIIVILQVLVQPYQVFIVLAILLFIVFFLFYYELREFLAYINLQLLRHLRGKTFEIYLPQHSKPIYGRIANIELLNSTIEDIYGRRIYVSNSLLVNSVLREHVPSVQLRITLNNVGENIHETLANILASFKDIDSGTFRIDDRRVVIERVSPNTVSFKLMIYPTSTPVRVSDVLDFINILNNLLSKYDPSIEIIELV